MPIKRKNATYVPVVSVADVHQYARQGDAARFEFLPKNKIRVLAKTTDQLLHSGAWRPSIVTTAYPQRRRRWHFTNGYQVPERQQQTWTIDPANILASVGTYNQDVKVGKLSWHPESGELLLSPVYDQHAATIHSYGQHPFDEYVRLIVLQDEQKVLARPWSPTGDLSDEDERVASFEAQYAAKEMLEKAGMPASWKFETDASNQRMERLTGRRGW